MKYRTIKEIIKAVPTTDGAGVRLKRVFGNYQTPMFDPFLLLDHFGSDNPDDYIAGFPEHPHRGIETITYMLHGKVEHRDSLGNGGVISDGDVQWMTAGSGIIHAEMPKRTEGKMEGFQLWANLPAKHKMMNPRYRDVSADTIPEIKREDGTLIKLISGTIDGVQGPVQDVVTDPTYMDITMEKNSIFEENFPADYTVFTYLISGEAEFSPDEEKQPETESAILLKNGDAVKIKTGEKGARFLLAAGKPLKESIAWRGPIVMTNQDELDIAFAELRNGTFLKTKNE